MLASSATAVYLNNCSQHTASTHHTHAAVPLPARRRHAFAASPTAAATPGKVYLVGAGPGAADLLTLRAAAVLQRADVVVTDALAGTEVLQHCRSECEIVAMGKRGGDDRATSQEDINTLIVERCRAGQTVVRLKGGDPLVFGRAADELRALRQNG